MARNTNDPQAETSDRRRPRIVQVKPTEATKVATPTKRFSTEVLAKASGTSGPSNRRPRAVEVKPTEAAKTRPKAKHLGPEVLAKAPGTSGPNNRRPTAVQVTERR